LERIKHFFSVPNVHFILGTHLAQLQNSVMVAYGSQIDAPTYLQKFIHLTLHLVDNTNRWDERVRTRYIKHLLEAMQFTPSQTTQHVEAYCSHVAEYRNLSLRTLEQIFSTLAIALAYKPQNLYCPYTILSGLCVLKITDAMLYLKAKNGNLKWDDVRVPLGFAVQPDEKVRHTIQSTSDHWQFCTEPTIDEASQLSRFNQGLWQYDIERERVVPMIANAIIDRLTPT
jgi:hypothetical protein